MSNVIPAVESVFALSLYFRKFLIYSHTREISEWHACDSHVLQYTQAIQLLWVQRVHLKGTRTNLSIPFQWYYGLSSKLFQLFCFVLFWRCGQFPERRPSSAWYTQSGSRGAGHKTSLPKNQEEQRPNLFGDFTSVEARLNLTGQFPQKSPPRSY